MPAATNYATYNRNWGLALLLLNAGLLSWLTMGDSLDEYVGRYAFWLLAALPAVLTGLAGLVAASLPRPLRPVFYALMAAGVLLTIAGALLGFYAASFLGGKW